MAEDLLDDPLAVVVMSLFEVVSSMEYHTIWEILRVDWQRLTPTLQRLEEAGYVKARRSINDVGACTWFTATRRGRRHYEQRLATLKL